MTKKKHWAFAAVFGLVLGGSFTLAAFTEPSSLPNSTTSYPPINAGADIQLRDGSLGLGNGTAQANQTLSAANTLYVSTNFATDSTTVRQNAILTGNVTVGNSTYPGRSIIAGALRAGQVVVSNDAAFKTATNPKYDSTGEKLYFPNGTTTNLIKGNTCNISNSGTCPAGTVLIKYNTNGGGTCRYINPRSNPGSNGNC